MIKQLKKGKLMSKGFATKDKVKTLAMEKMLTVSDKKLFLHPSMTSYIQGLLEGMISRYDKHSSFPGSILWEPKNGAVAYTNGNRWVCNAGNPFISKAKSKTKGITDRNYRIMLTTGLCIHELGHRLYTNFLYEAKFIFPKLASTGVLFPSPTIKLDEWDELQTLLQGDELKYRNTFIRMYKNISNALEDGYIEYRLLDDFPHPSNKDALLTVRERHLASLPSLEKNIEAEHGEDAIMLFSIINLLLGYAKYGQIKCKKSEYSDERIQTIVTCIPHIDELNMSFTPYAHYTEINNVVALLSPYILKWFKYMDELDSGEDEMSAGMDCAMSDDIKCSDEDMEKMESPDSMGMPIASSLEEKAETEAEDGGVKADEERKEMGDSGEEQEDVSRHDHTDLDADIDYSDKCSEKTTPIHEDVDSEGKDWDEITKIAKQIVAEEAKKDAISELEDEHLSRLKVEDSDIEYGNLHVGRGCRIERKKNVSDSQKEAYHKLAKDYLPLSKAANREYIKKIKELGEEATIKGRYSGQFDVAGAYRPDKRMFSKKRLPSPVSLSVFLLIDESGSMCGERIEMARITAIIVEEFCRLTGIRLCIMGHTEDFYRKQDVVLTSYTDFESYDSNDKYRLMDIEAKENNRDGYALRYAMNHLKKESTDVKLILNISDGAPAAECYGGAKAVAELKSIVKECDRNNISVISAAIGSDRETIKQIYGKGFLNISDLNMLPKTFIALIKKYMPDA